ncbi:MAG: Lrp/AsnC family transcriptional regulator [Pseudomonadota bacterium]|nr:Lrp/AsnC family transcriptional regulator [Pseudomonadota bacterium]
MAGFSLKVEPKALGFPLAAYIHIRPMPGNYRKTAVFMTTLDPVVEWHRVTGEDCFIATAHLRSIEELEAVIDEIIAFATTNTSILQSTAVPRRTRLLA